MTTMISNLPSDLMEEIMSRVPLKCMKAVRLTCKSWNNLCKSESFTKMHIGKATTTREGETMIIATRGHNLYLTSVVVDDVDSSIERKGQLRFLHNQVNVTQIYHYEGLLLCILKDATRIVVWNPYLGQTRWIELRYSHRPDGWDVSTYALGYEIKESCRSFKILRFIDYFSDKAPELQFFWYEIYNFDSGLWKTLDVTPHWRISCSTPSVSLKGNTYCCAIERGSNTLQDHIICFDYTRERFGPLLRLPVDVRAHNYGIVTLSCFKEEKLAALFQHHYEYAPEFEIWITTKIEAEMISWSKFLKMDTEPKIAFPISIFIDEEKKLFMAFGKDFDSHDYPTTFVKIIGKTGYLKELDIGVPADVNCLPNAHVCSYVPSLVQIKKPAGGKEINQSSLEKRRFDQNKLTLDAIQKLRRSKKITGGRMHKRR